MEDSALLAQFEVEETARYIADGGYERVALQFPDELVHCSVAVHAAVSRRVPADAFVCILADSTFDGGQVDFVAAQHIDAQLIVHYGGAQLDVSGPIAVRLVFPRKHLDVAPLARAVRALTATDAAEAPRHLAVVYDLSYAHCMASLATELSSDLADRVTVATVPRDYPAAAPSGDEPAPPQPGAAAAGGSSGRAPVRLEGFLLALPPSVELDECAIAYVGDEDAPLDALVLTRSTTRFFRFDPSAESGGGGGALAPLTLDSARRLRRRYYLVQRARDARTFGLVVATLSAAHFREVLDELKRAISAAGRRHYVLLMGKVNPAKLANFPDIACFVLLASPRAAMVDSKEFLAPLITPYELLLALRGGDEWSGQYELDYGRLLPMLRARAGDASSGAADGNGGDGDAGDAPRLSLVTGTLQSFALGGDAPPSSGSPAAADGTVARAHVRTVGAVAPSHGGAAFLAARSWRGLDSTAGTHAVQATVPAGRAGVASGYACEGQERVLSLIEEANASINESALLDADADADEHEGGAQTAAA